MPEYDEEDSYNWYCSNVGAKWCHIEEWEGDYMNLCSAWSDMYRVHRESNYASSKN